MVFIKLSVTIAFSFKSCLAKGKALKIMVGHREYNGKTYIDAKAFYPTRLAPYSKTEEPELDII